MNQKELIAEISQQTGVTKSAAEKLLKCLGPIIASQLKAVGSITLPDIGTFRAVETAERQGRNPKTGEEITIAAGKRIKLKVAKALKDAV